MGLAIGKRKRTATKVPPAKKRVKSPSPEPSDSEDLRDAFRRAFEAKFKPLEGVSKPETKEPEPADESESEEENEEEDSEWEGISGDEKGNQVEVVEVSGPRYNERASKSELKAFMVGFRVDWRLQYSYLTCRLVLKTAFIGRRLLQIHRRQSLRERRPPLRRRD